MGHVVVDAVGLNFAGDARVGQAQSYKAGGNERLFIGAINGQF